MVRTAKRIFLFFILILFASVGNSQDSLYLQIDTDELIPNPEFRPPVIPVFQDTIDLQKYLNEYTSQLHLSGFLEANIDSLRREDNKYIAHLHLGQKYWKVQINNGNIESSFLEKLRYKLPRQFRWEELTLLKEKLLTIAENNGYPFAQVWMDSFHINESSNEAKIFLQRNQLILIEGIKIIGDANISEDFLMNFLSFKKSEPYSQEKILGIRKQLNNLPFIKSSKSPKITFLEDKATIYLFLDKKNASRFDLILGVLPNSNPLIGRRLLVTGTGLLDLQNAFGKGERLFLEYQQLRPQSPEFEMAFSYPYIANTLIGADLRFNLYKRDTSYLDLEYDIGIQYLLGGNNYIKVFANNRSSRLLNIDENHILTTRQLPSRLDVSNTSFGVAYFQQNLDYQFNPRKGWSLKVRAGIGNKTIPKNQKIIDLNDPSEPSFDFGSLYEDFEAEQLQYRLEGTFDFYLPFGKRNTIKTSLNSGWFYSESSIFQNEQFRIGGNRLLRGFDEESIFADFYSIATVEYRWLLTQNSNVFLFTDIAYTEDNAVGQKVVKRPLGMGIGISFETSAGVFGLSAALGRDLANVNDFFDFRSPKIHFGYVSLF